MLKRKNEPVIRSRNNTEYLKAISGYLIKEIN